MSFDINLARHELNNSANINEKFNPDIRISTDVKKDVHSTSYDPDRRVDDKYAHNSSEKQKINDCENGELDKILNEYKADLLKYSEFSEDIDNPPLDSADFRNITVEESVQAHKEYSDMKNDLRGEWEIKHGQEWPRYKTDVYITNENGDKIKIRNAGDRYDLHHKHPLSMGGENIVENITPMRADVHMDHRGIHSLEASYGKLTSYMKETG